jgi:GNAT superfamily N-acetyltransferase
MDQTVIIRKATSDDLDKLYQFEQGVIEAERPFDPTLKSEKIHYYNLREMLTLAHVQVLVAEVENNIVGSGYARIEKAKPYLKHDVHAYLGFMYVQPEYRGKGINKMIIEALHNWARTQNVSELRLDVYFNNLSAIRAYEKIGFTPHMIEMRFNPDN